MGKKKYVKILYIVAVLVPFYFGIKGGLSDGQTLDVALFNCVLMFTWGYDEVPGNMYVSIARWIAPLITISGIACVFSAIRYRLWNFYCYAFGNRIAIYGNENIIDDLKNECGWTTVTSNDVNLFLRADRYIMLLSEKENIYFYQKFADRLQGTVVYMRGDRYKQLLMEDNNIRVFCPEENAVRVFWKELPLYVDEKVKRDEKHALIIILIGFGAIGENLIYWGLQHNLYHPEQRIEYHVYAKDCHFISIYHEIEGNLTDKVCFHEDEWFESIGILQEASHVILCEQENQEEIIQEFIYAIPQKKLHVFAAKDSFFSTIKANERIYLFNWKDIAYRKSSIMTDKLYILAKRINIQYAVLYGDVAPVDAVIKMDEEWNNLSAFNKYSNISAADFLENIIALLKFWGYSPDRLEDIPPCVFDVLGNLEHMRWARFHYLNNWKYGVPQNGKNKDEKARIHKCLIPYDELDDIEKHKDLDNIKMLIGCALE